MKKLKEESFYLNKEFNYIITDIINNEEFQKLKKITHHGITRFNHSLRVSYYTFLISKRLKLNYVEATRAALLHDFFIDETSEMKTKKALKEHPKIALENSKKYFDISRMQEDIILKHMYPITTKMPKYKESWLVDIVDDIASLYEKTYSVNKEVKTAINFIFIMLFIRFR
ncbi:MAG: HD domain-containing protein [Bacilli bacterium]|nr:HD domain-containing protein [Bacilli bacterium]